MAGFTMRQISTAISSVLALLALIASAPAHAAETAAADGFISVGPIGALIIENGRVNGQLKVTLKMVPETDADAAELAGRIQVWRGKLLVALNEFARLNVSIYRPVDAVKLRSALLGSLKKDGAKVKDVLLLDVVAY